MLFAVTFAAGYTLARSPVHARGAARSAVRAAAPTEFASEDEHLAALDAIAELPAGFRVGTSGFTFTPKEAKITATMNLTAVVLDKPTSNWAAVFTRNAFCGAPIKIGRKRLSEGKALQAILPAEEPEHLFDAADDDVEEHELVEFDAEAAKADSPFLPTADPTPKDDLFSDRDTTGVTGAYYTFTIPIKEIFEPFGPSARVGVLDVTRRGQDYLASAARGAEVVR